MGYSRRVKYEIHNESHQKSQTINKNKINCKKLLTKKRRCIMIKPSKEKNLTQEQRTNSHSKTKEKS